MCMWEKAPWALVVGAALAAGLGGSTERAGGAQAGWAAAPPGRAAAQLAALRLPPGQQWCLQDAKIPPSTQEGTQQVWQSDYGRAYRQAQQEGRMLLVNFTASHPDQRQFEQALAARRDLRAYLAGYVLVAVPVDAQVTIQGRSQSLIAHPAFAEMHRQPGIAIVDLAHQGQPFYGRVVSAFPFSRGKYYRWDVNHLPVILTLPPGTLTQRTMIWAVRTHPEHPASTDGAMDPVLTAAAAAQSSYQARLGRQGHHRWETRFQRLRHLLGGGLPVEVVAESWPGQDLNDSCIDCVSSWRQSSGHWNAVRNWHGSYGYDIRRGANGIWYATGIFVTRR